MPVRIYQPGHKCATFAVEAHTIFRQIKGFTARWNNCGDEILLNQDISASEKIFVGTIENIAVLEKNLALSAQVCSTKKSSPFNFIDIKLLFNTLSRPV